MDHPQLFTTKATVGSCAALVAIGVMLAAYGPVIEQFRTDFGVSAAAVGFTIAMQPAGAVIGVLVAQPALRRVGNRLTMMASMALMALGCAVIAGSPVWAMTVAGSAVAGLGLGGCDALTTQLFVFGQGRSGPVLVNVVHGCFGVGTVLAPSLLALVGVANYRIVFGLAAVISLVAAATMTGLTPRPTPADHAANRAVDGTGLGSMRTAMVVGGFLLLFILHFGVQSGLGNWGPSRLLALGHSSSDASTIIAGYWAAMVLGRFAVAPLTRRVPLPVLVIGSCVGMTLAILLAFDASATSCAYVLAGLFIGPIFPNGLTWLAHSDCAPGAAFAYVIAAAMAGAAVFPPILGTLVGGTMGTDALAPTLLIGSVLAVSAGALIVIAARRQVVSARSSPSTGGGTDVEAVAGALRNDVRTPDNTAKT